MVEELGHKLRAAREKLGLSIADLAAQTKVKEQYLAAIEQDAYNLLPGPVYARAFLRLYAREVGLNSDEVMAWYDELHTVQLGRQSLELVHDDEAPHRRYSFSAGFWRWSFITALVATIVVARWYTTALPRETEPNTKIENVQPEPAPPLIPPNDTAQEESGVQTGSEGGSTTQPTQPGHGSAPTPVAPTVPAVPPTQAAQPAPTTPAPEAGQATPGSVRQGTTGGAGSGMEVTWTETVPVPAVGKPTDKTAVNQPSGSVGNASTTGINATTGSAKPTNTSVAAPNIKLPTPVALPPVTQSKPVQSAVTQPTNSTGASQSVHIGQAASSDSGVKEQSTTSGQTTSDGSLVIYPGRTSVNNASTPVMPNPTAPAGGM